MRGNIVIFMDHPRCSADGVNSIMHSLYPHYKFKILTRHKLSKEELKTFWDGVDIFCVPGGLGDVGTFNKIMKNHIPHIKQFLENGGRYLGICMGAYWAGSNYFNLLKGRDCVQYLTRPKTDTRRPHAKDLEVTWNGNKENIFWYDGCSIVGRGKFDVVATYANGDAMAGYQNRIGLIGSHPEAQKWWYTMYSWMRPKWEGRERNNTLLLNFVDELMRR